jgi:hypothetical protein
MRGDGRHLTLFLALFYFCRRPFLREKEKGKREAKTYGKIKGKRMSERNQEVKKEKKKRKRKKEKKKASLRLNLDSFFFFFCHFHFSFYASRPVPTGWNEQKM